MVQSRFQVPLPTAMRRACMVCEQPLDRLLALTPRRGAATSLLEFHPVCRDLACRQIFEAAAPLPDAEFRRQLQHRGLMRREGAARMAIRDRFRREREAAEAREEAAVFAAFGPRVDPGSSPAVRLTVPSGHAPQRPLPKRRRKQFIAHLDKVIAAVASDRAEPPAPGEGPSVPIGAPAPGEDAADANVRLSHRLCGVCGGACCVAGDTHAFIDEQTIRRVLAADPGLDPERLRAIYLGYLPRRTIPGSCVNHTRHGCSLPRSLRANICNDFACEPLRRLKAAVKADPSVRKAIVLRRQRVTPTQDHDLIGAAVITETATTRLRLPKPEERAAAAAEEGMSSS